MSWGMIGWEVPLERYPDTYNGQPLLYAALAAQKNYTALYLNCVYASQDRMERLRAASESSAALHRFVIGCIISADMLPRFLRGVDVGEQLEVVGRDHALLDER